MHKALASRQYLLKHKYYKKKNIAVHLALKINIVCNIIERHQHNLKTVKGPTQQLTWSVARPLCFERDLLFF